VPAGEATQVTLRRPPPLDTPLRVVRTGAALAVYDGEVLVAEAEPVRLGEEPAPPVGYAQAVAAAAAYPGFVDHPFPSCYVCGPQRASGDGLRIFPGPVGQGTAAPWSVPADASPLTVWAALDCPGGWAIISPGRPYVLGRMAAALHRPPPRAGTECVVTGQVVANEGRKAHVKTALYEPDGALVAQASSTWIAI
jgi:acyl-coenzyme A thioesterase PaaI-like protein